MNHLGLHLFFSIAFCSVLVAQTAPKPLNFRIVPRQELKRESTIPQKAPNIFVPDTIKAIQKTEPQPEIHASENAKTDTLPSPPKKTTVATKPPSISNLPTSVRYIGTGTFELSFDVSEPCFLESGEGGVLVWFNDLPMARVTETLSKSGETYVFRTTIVASAPAGPANVKIKATNENGATSEITNPKFVIYPEIGDSGNPTELPIILGRMSRMVDTDMSSRQIAGLSLQSKEAFNANRLDTATLPGSAALIGGVSYWRPDLATIDKVIQTLMGFGSIADKEVIAKINTEDTDASKDSRRNMTLKEVNLFSQETDLDKPKQYLKQQKLVVEILDGYGGAGQANRLAAHLKKFGIAVRSTGNAASFQYKETLIVDWKGKRDASLALSQLLSIDPTKIIVYDRPEKTLGITIVLGKDWVTSKQHIYEQKPIQEAKPVTP